MIVHPFLFVVIINHPSIAVHNKNIYCSDILFEIQTFFGGAFSILFSVYIYIYICVCVCVCVCMCVCVCVCVRHPIANVFFLLGYVVRHCLIHSVILSFNNH